MYCVAGGKDGCCVRGYCFCQFGVNILKQGGVIGGGVVGVVSDTDGFKCVVSGI